MKVSETSAKLLRELVYKRLKNHISPFPEEQFKENWDAILQELSQLEFELIPPSHSELGILKYKK